MVRELGFIGRNDEGLDGVGFWLTVDGGSIFKLKDTILVGGTREGVTGSSQEGWLDGATVESIGGGGDEIKPERGN